MSPTVFYLGSYKKSLSRFSFALILCIHFFSLSAQTRQAHNIFSPSIHLRHVVKSHETFTSIGKLYGVSGEEVADYNNLEYYSDEVLAKYLTIPLTNHNYSADAKALPGQISVPVFKIKGTSERLVPFKRTNKRRPLGYSVFFTDNSIIARYGSQPFVVGYLHTSKANGAIFKTVEPVVATSTVAIAGTTKNDTTKTVVTAKPVPPIIDTITSKIRFTSTAGSSNLSTVPTKEPKTQLKNVPPDKARRSVIHRPISKVAKVYLLVKIQLIITALLVVVIFLLVYLKNKREVFKAQLNASIRSLLINEVLSEDSFSENLQKEFSIPEYLTSKIDRKSSRQFVIDEILRGRNNIKGKAGENFLKLYLKLHLEKDSYDKLKSKNWEDVAKGIQELAIMGQNQMMPEIFNEINSKNEYVRMEAQSALVRLSGFGGLWFLNVLNYPISEYQQMKLINQLLTSPVSDIPDLHRLLTSPNESLVIFTLKLISVFQQHTMHNAVVKCLNNRSEVIRFHAIKCLKEINNQYTASTLIRKFSTETRRNKIAIVNVIGEIGDSETADFLLQVLSVKDDTLRMCAAKALSKLGGNATQLLEEYTVVHGDPYTQILLHIKSANSYDLV